MDMISVKGQEAAKRAIEIALSGQHNILLVGPTSCGKTMLANAVRTMAPEYQIRDDLDLYQEEHRAVRRTMDEGLPTLACASDTSKLPASLIDRFAIVVAMQATNAADMLRPPPGETSATVKDRIRLSKSRERAGDLDANANRLLREGAEAFGLTSRAFLQVTAVAQTAATMDGLQKTTRLHVAEALIYRQRQEPVASSKPIAA